ncbi:hypothetical protein C7999DRAFT_42454 [Corynascus novoguineensis]|uniref:J domain-containing protein n=1 Tax=Corynascus novoguineensis TaxID=1126955 RepID=A0AAN7HHS9_9PEZI|nr:hypothetical protein C7999DRAFT_42454 [Corynascus novoguineensis]
MVLLSALEAVYMVLAACSPSFGEYLVSAGEHGARMVSKQGTRWLVATVLTSIASVVPTIKPGPQPLETPYSVLGVTTSSSTSEITRAYEDLTSKTWREKRRQAYHDAYQTLVDPLQRCIYHRNSGIPDWYGVPTLCGSEFAIDRLWAAKRFIRARLGDDDLSPKAAAALHLLKAKFIETAKTASALANATSRQTPPCAQQQADLSDTVWRRCLNWFKPTLFVLLAAIKFARWPGFIAPVLLKMRRKFQGWLRPVLLVLVKADQIRNWAASRPSLTTFVLVGFVLVSGASIHYFSRGRLKKIGTRQKKKVRFVS